MAGQPLLSPLLANRTDPTNPATPTWTASSPAPGAPMYAGSFDPQTRTPSPTWGVPQVPSTPAPYQPSPYGQAFVGAKGISDISSRGGAMAGDYIGQQVGGQMGGAIGGAGGAIAGQVAGSLLEDLLTSADKREQEKAIRNEIRRQEDRQRRETLRQEVRADSAQAKVDARDALLRPEEARQASYINAYNKSQNQRTRASQIMQALSAAAASTQQGRERLVTQGY